MQILFSKNDCLVYLVFNLRITILI